MVSSPKMKTLSVLAVISVGVGEIRARSEEGGCLKEVFGPTRCIRSSSESQPITEAGNHTIYALIKDGNHKKRTPLGGKRILKNENSEPSRPNEQGLTDLSRVTGAIQRRLPRRLSKDFSWLNERSWNFNPQCRVT